MPDDNEFTIEQLPQPPPEEKCLTCDAVEGLQRLELLFGEVVYICDTCLEQGRQFLEASKNRLEARG
jgi:hypothetical protein